MPDAHRLVVPEHALLPHPSPILFELMAEVGYNAMRDSNLAPDRVSRPEHAYRNQPESVRADWECVAREMYGLLAKRAGAVHAPSAPPK